MNKRHPVTITNLYDMIQSLQERVDKLESNRQIGLGIVTNGCTPLSNCGWGDKIPRFMSMAAKGYITT